MYDSEKTKKRSAYWDNIKGVLIFLVVFGHCLYGLRNNRANSILDNAIYYFHMPAFVFVAGFFSRSEHSRKSESILKLLIAYSFLNGYFVLSDVLQGAEQPHILSAYKSEWFLMALVFWRILTPFLTKFRKITIVIIIFSILVGFWKNLGGQTILAINKIVTFYPYFLFGYQFPENIIEKIKKTVYRKRLLYGGILLFLATLTEIISDRFLDITMYDLLPHAYRHFGLNEPLARISIMVVSALMISCFLFLSVDRTIPLLTKTGRNSLAIYLLHRPLTVFLDNFLKPYHVSIQMGVSLIASVLMLWILGSDLSSGLINNALDKAAGVLLHKEMDQKEARVTEIILYGFFILVFISPIIAGLIK